MGSIRRDLSLKLFCSQVKSPSKFPKSRVKSPKKHDSSPNSGKYYHPLLSHAQIPLMLALQGGQLFLSIQEISGYLAPPIAAVFMTAVLWTRCNEKGAFWGLMAGICVGVIRMIIVFALQSKAGSCVTEDLRWVDETLLARGWNCAQHLTNPLPDNRVFATLGVSVTVVTEDRDAKLRIQCHSYSGTYPCEATKTHMPYLPRRLDAFRKNLATWWWSNITG